MDGWWWWALLGIALVVMLVEWHIMRTPEAERSGWQRRFMTASRRTATGYNRGMLKLLPIVMPIGAALMLLGTLPLWFAEQFGIAIFLTVFAVASGVGGILFARWIRKRRGPEWWEKYQEANEQADREGRPRWFGSTRGGVVLGGFFVLAGASFLALPLGADETVRFTAVVLVVLGAVCLTMAVVQHRRENRPSGG